MGGKGYMDAAGGGESTPWGDSVVESLGSVSEVPSSRMRARPVFKFVAAFRPLLSAVKSLHLATCPDLRHGFHDDLPLVPALAAHGIHAHFTPWQEIDPADPEPVLVRSPWDYTLHRERFGAWLDALVASGTPCLNPARLMRWNLDKRYLLELEARGHRIVPTRLMEAFDAAGAQAISAEAGWERAIAKPIVGAGASGLVRISADGVQPFSAEGNTWAPDTDAFPVGPCFVQPEIPAIHSEGEWSLFFFGGKFSHAVRKLPAAGDIRVQEEHGGRTVSDVPPAATRQAAEGMLKDLPEPSVYARVDGVHHDGAFCLMELELIEPEMFLRHEPRAAARFADVVAKRLGELGS